MNKSRNDYFRLIPLLSMTHRYHPATESQIGSKPQVVHNSHGWRRRQDDMLVDTSNMWTVPP